MTGLPPIPDMSQGGMGLHDLLQGVWVCDRWQTSHAVVLKTKLNRFDSHPFSKICLLLAHVKSFLLDTFDTILGLH